jgi:protein tyrosine phosphatase (PTP) superfamily phosphohydrolase (DUF442 family)
MPPLESAVLAQIEQHSTPVLTASHQLPIEAGLSPMLKRAKYSVVKWLFDNLPLLGATLAREKAFLTRPKPGDDKALVQNFEQMSDTLTRGRQTTMRGFEVLKRHAGVNVDFNLRVEETWEKPWAQKAGLSYEWLPIGLFGPRFEQGDAFLARVALAEKQGDRLFLHCKSGSDRTGALSAIYRVTRQGMPVDEALREMAAYGSNANFQRVDRQFVIDYVNRWESATPAFRAKVFGQSVDPLSQHPIQWFAAPGIKPAFKAPSDLTPRGLRPSTLLPKSNQSRWVPRLNSMVKQGALRATVNPAPTSEYSSPAPSFGYRQLTSAPIARL